MENVPWSSVRNRSELGTGQRTSSATWERGLIDMEKENEYNVKARPTKIHLQEMALAGVEYIEDTEFDLRYIIGECEDFKNEVSMLGDTVEKRGGGVIFSPKCHPEMAGQGVEYIWGRGKYRYKRKRSEISGSISTSAFTELVKWAMGTTGDDPSISRKFAMKCARRARMYRLAYYEMNRDREANGDDVEGVSQYDDIEKVVEELKRRTYKCHRGVYTDRRLYEY